MIRQARLALIRVIGETRNIRILPCLMIGSALDLITSYTAVDHLQEFTWSKITSFLPLASYIVIIGATEIGSDVRDSLSSLANHAKDSVEMIVDEAKALIPKYQTFDLKQAQAFLKPYEQRESILSQIDVLHR